MLNGFKTTILRVISLLFLLVCGLYITTMSPIDWKRIFYAFPILIFSSYLIFKYYNKITIRKSILIPCIFASSFLFSHSEAKTQDWTTQTSNTANILYSVFYLNSNDVWAVGDGATVIYSSDGGVNWVNQTITGGGFINDVYFANSSLGWAAISSGKIAKTSDGGNNWTTINIGVGDNVYALVFLNNSDGFLVGDSGLLRKSTDGGDTWNAVTSNTSSNLWSLKFANSNVAYAVGAIGEVIKTTDSGLNWTSVSTGFGATHWDVSVVSEQIVYVSGDNGSVYKTTNGGTSWNALNTGLTQVLYGVSFLDEDRGYVAGEDGKILYTSDGGATWNDQSLLTSTVIYRIRFFDDNSGMVVGDGGLVAKFALLTPQNISLSRNDKSSTTISVSANIANDNGFSISSRGFVYSKSNNSANISDNDGIISSGQGTGTFANIISDLESGTRYYIRAFATNTNGTTYSDAIEVTTNLSISLDGNQDGILDSTQVYVYTLYDENREEYITIESLEQDSLYEVEILNGIETGFAYPLGILSFKVNASFATIKIYYHGTSSLQNYSYRKQAFGGIYYQFANANFSVETIDANPTATVTLSLIDGQAGDYDGIVNGVIYDPGGPAISATAINAPIWDDFWRIVVIAGLVIIPIYLLRRRI